MSLLLIRRRGSLRDRDEVEFDDICELADTHDVDLSSIEPLLAVDSTDVVDGIRPSRLNR